ncbi:hypothetical protein [Deinococcus ruber]|uniref:Uncharacterized protein n=1 Tax=Deinococcus ruber TaxID=1848197 RepID=A0A918FHG0_9DEIO|nr:hypothetical protein [Deinococcus ruber]GGR37878.1 hypothetical protein GCM10008957_53960 [Deinococcus ruber]
MTDTHPYTIKALKTLATSDGFALTAQLYREKTCVASVENGGQGGPTWASFISRDEEQQFSAWVATLNEKTYPAGEGMPEFTVKPTTETALDLLITAVEEAKEAKKLDRNAQTSLVYRTVNDGEETYRKAPLPPSLQGRPISEIVALYRARADWFHQVTTVWVIGQGWTSADSL